jgi:catechol 2,3-dioxygenase-like lactoylglutathione lyase family enzyme
LIKNLSHISLSTNSLKKVKDFYIKKLKLKIVHTFKNDKKFCYGYFISVGKTTMLEFFLSKKKKKNSFPLRHICFEVYNIFSQARKLKIKKDKISRGKTDNILQFFVKDLEGNIIEFHQKDKKSKFLN